MRAKRRPWPFSPSRRYPSPSSPAFRRSGDAASPVGVDTIRSPGGIVCSVVSCAVEVCTSECLGDD